MQRLETPSLLLEPLTRDDYPWLFVLYADPEVMRYIGTGVRGEEQSRKTLDGQLAQGERLGFGYWVIRDRQDRSPLGGGMLMVRQEGAPVELGFLLERAAWGRGIASEAARAPPAPPPGPPGLPQGPTLPRPAHPAAMGGAGQA